MFAVQLIANSDSQAVEDDISRDIENEENDFLQHFVVGELNISPASGSRLKRKTRADGT